MFDVFKDNFVIQLLIRQRISLLPQQIKLFSSNNLFLSHSKMIQLKIRGSNTSKRTIIDSLRCEFIKEKDKFYMMRFKSLPTQKRAVRNSLRTDIPDYFKPKKTDFTEKLNYRPPVQIDDFPNCYLDSSIKQLGPRQHLQFYQQDQEHNQIMPRNRRQRVKSMVAIEESQEKDQRRIKTIQDELSSKNSNSSLRDYINKFFTLKSTYIESDKQQISRLTQTNAQQIQAYRKPRNFHSIAITKKQQIQQNCVEELFKGQLSPKICRIHKLQPQQQSDNQNILKRKIKQSSKHTNLEGRKKLQKLQSYLLPVQPQPQDKVLPLKVIKKDIKQITSFKQSLGPWRNSGFGFKPQMNTDSTKAFLS